MRKFVVVFYSKNAMFALGKVFVKASDMGKAVAAAREEVKKRNYADSQDPTAYTFKTWEIGDGGWIEGE